MSGTASSTLAGTHEVRMFLETDAYYDQTFFVGVSQIAAATGAWSIDLSPLPGGFAGSISFGVFEIGPSSGNTTSEAQVGLHWPHPYENYQVESYTVADATYLVATSTATSDNAWSFDSSFVGAKYVAVRNTLTNTIVAEYTGAGTGLVRSFVLEPGDAGHGTSFESRSYMYDQALALSVAISEGDDAEAHSLAAGLIATQRDGTTGADTPVVAGAYPFSAPQSAPQATDPSIRVGAMQLQHMECLNIFKHIQLDH